MIYEDDIIRRVRYLEFLRFKMLKITAKKFTVNKLCIGHISMINVRIDELRKLLK